MMKSRMKNAVVALVSKTITVMQMATKVWPRIGASVLIVAMMCGRASMSIETKTAAIVGQMVMEWT